MDEVWVPTQVGQHPQLHLAVVSTNQDTAWAGYKGIPDVDLLLTQALSGKSMYLCPHNVLGDSLQANNV